jgi:quercetin dioxygenase-like cupin family protein
MIEPGIAHQLVNTGDEPLILIFGRPVTRAICKPRVNSLFHQFKDLRGKY